MPFTKFTNLDFDQIKTSIKDYLRANSDFTDFDFEGSNFSVLIDALAYNTYITAFNSNMIVNESFLDSATIRENVVSLARNIGYVPRSRKSAESIVSFSISTDVDTETLTLQAGPVCVGSVDNSSYIFSIFEDISAPAILGQNGIRTATFDNIVIYQGTYLTKQFTVNGSLDQRFILDNSGIDASTIKVYVRGVGETGLGKEYFLVDNIINVTSISEIYLLQEVLDERYELLFGDGIFGKKLENGAVITVGYIITDGKEGNGPSSFAFSGTLRDDSILVSGGNTIVPTSVSSITTIQAAINGSDIESVDSIKYYAPRLYEAQSRAVTSRDFESIIKNKIYPNTESVSVIGGEELDPPEYGNVIISIKPKNGTFVSDFDKTQILSKIKQYTISGIKAKIIDLKILYVEIESYIYYNNSQVSSIGNLKTKVVNSLTKYSNSVDLNTFGGRFKYSKVLQVIDNTDNSITSNITKVRIRRDLRALINQFSQYELCFGNRFHVNPEGFNIKSTGFRIEGESDIVYFSDKPNPDGKTGVLFIVKESDLSLDQSQVILRSAGTINYEKGEILINTIYFTSTELPDNIIEIQAFPESNDIVGLKDLYLSLDISKSQINMVRDVIASGDDISGVVFSRDSYRSSYSNGKLKRG
jgi:hypothetical protein